MLMYDLTIWVATLIVAIPVFYLAILTVLSFTSPPDFSGNEGNLKTDDIAVVIPAHNEELLIGQTVQSVLTNASGISVFVIADNCSDNTAEIAQAAGGTVVVRNDDNNRGKGQALDWFIQTNKNELARYPLICIIDADSLLTESFFHHIRRAFQRKTTLVAQAFYDVANPKDGWRNALLSIALRAFHHTRPAGRNALGGSAGLKGNGMVFRSALLCETGWPAYSIVEDLEQSLQLISRGIAVAHIPDAIILGDMPFSNKAATTQRSRWEGGRWAIARQWIPKLAKRFRTDPSWLYADAIADLATPPLSLLVAAQLVLCILWLFGSTTGLIFSLSLLLLTALHVTAGLIQTKAPMHLWRALLLAPCYVFWKLTVYAALSKAKHLHWTRSEREGNKK